MSAYARSTGCVLGGRKAGRKGVKPKIQVLMVTAKNSGVWALWFGIHLVSKQHLKDTG